MKEKAITRDPIEVAGNIVYLSFRYSQGQKHFQSRLFDWVVSEGYLNSANLPDQAPSTLLERNTPKKHYGGQVTNPVSMYEGYWFKLRSKLKQPELELTREELVQELALWFLFKDIDFQYRERPNRNQDKKAEPDSNSDPHASFTRKYALLREFAGERAYDDLFTEIGAVVISNRSKEYANKSIYEIEEELNVVKKRGENNIPLTVTLLEKRWEKNHPGNRFF